MIPLSCSFCLWLGIPCAPLRRLCESVVVGPSATWPERLHRLLHRCQNDAGGAGSALYCLSQQSLYQDLISPISSLLYVSRICLQESFFEISWPAQPREVLDSGCVSGVLGNLAVFPPFTACSVARTSAALTLFRVSPMGCDRAG